HVTLIERGGMIIVPAAPYPRDDESAELACAAIHPAYRHGARRHQLREQIAAEARRRSRSQLLVPTTGTAHWRRGGCSEHSSVERLPQQRAQLYNYQRNAKVFEKNL